VPNGVYRTRITADDLRAARATAAGNRPAIATLTLRNGRWRLELREPGRTVQRGTYAGPALRTTWTYEGAQPSTSYVSIVVGRDSSLRFHVVTAYDTASARATFASHPFERIDR
jgi:hypothetical protein